MATPRRILTIGPFSLCLDAFATSLIPKRKTKEIYKQKEQVAQIKEKETKKTAEKVLSDMNKENKKLRDELESLNRKIVKHRAEIESIKVKIRNNLEDQYLKKQAISKQRGYVRGIEAMAQSIR